MSTQRLVCPSFAFCLPCSVPGTSQRFLKTIPCKTTHFRLRFASVSHSSCPIALALRLGRELLKGRCSLASKKGPTKAENKPCNMHF